MSASDRISNALATRYRIERELGAGGMATVYLAEDLKHDRKVAIKVLKPELAAVLGAERFVQEIKTTAQLQHPHILPLHDSGTADGFLFYVMPYIEGETLREKLDRETQLGIDEAVRITREVADALDYAHRRGIIHRDIKPENILLHDGRPMVADFGIALAVSAAAGGRMTETGTSVGTPHYMSPEQATADREITARSDVYSLATVLYEMLTGEPPHMASSAQQVIMKIITDAPRPVSELRKSVPPNVAAALTKALEKLPADRFESASRFAEALANPSFGTGAGPQRSLKAGRWNAVSISASAIAVLMTVVAIRGWTRSQPEMPVRRYSILLPEAEGLSMGPVVLGRRLALSSDGMQLAYVGSGDAAGAPQIRIRRRDQLHADSVSGSGTYGDRAPFFSPDDSRLGFFSADQSLWVVGLSGEPRTLLNAEDLAGSGAAWGSDGYIYAAKRAQRVGVEYGIVRIPENGGAVEGVTRIDTARLERSHQWPKWLPSGKGVLFSVSTGPGLEDERIAVVDLRTGEHRHLVAGVAAWYAGPGQLVYVTADGTLVAAPFDEDRLQLEGPGHAVLNGISVTPLGVDLALSRSGDLIYVSGASGIPVQPFWVDRQGTAEAIDPDWTFPSAALYSTVALSPDGTRLVVSQSGDAGQQLFVKQLPRGPNMQLTFAGSLNSRASWTGDGREIVFVSDRAGFNQVWRQVRDGSVPAERVSEAQANDGFFSHEGDWFIYRGAGGDRHIYARRTEGDTAVLVVARSARGEDLAPTLSPDGRWIAYVSDESGRHEVYVRPFPEVTRTKSQVSTVGGIEPRWSRNSGELFYRNATDELVSVTFETDGAAFVAGIQQVLLSMHDYLPGNVYQATYDVAPDGGFILCKRVATDNPSDFEQLIVVENFLTDLRRTIEP